MTSFASLYACPRADVTFARLQTLLNEEQTESLTLEYKERYSAGVPKSIAAMANSYGGLVIIGVRDTGPSRVVGVPAEAITQIANGCHERLEPPWEPEVIAVSIPAKDAQDQDGEKFLVVVRIDPARAPRPIMLDGTVPIRLSGRNATADRSRVASLFAEGASPVSVGSRRVSQPRLPQDVSGSSEADLVIRTGMWVPVDASATWRPLSERAIDGLAEALSASPLENRLLTWNEQLGCAGFIRFRREGLNRARRARLVWQSAEQADLPPRVAAIVEIVLPTSQGVTVSALEFTVDVVIRIEPSDAERRLSPQHWLDISTLYSTVESLVAALTSAEVVDAIGLVAEIDPILVPQPRSLDFVTAAAVDEVLSNYRLIQVPNAGSSRGANLLADPTLDLADPQERQEQVDGWLTQIALDAGLRGIEGLLSEHHQTS